MLCLAIGIWLSKLLLLKLDRQEDAAEEWKEVLRLDPSLEKKETE